MKIVPGIKEVTSGFGDALKGAVGVVGIALGTGFLGPIGAILAGILVRFWIKDKMGDMLFVLAVFVAVDTFLEMMGGDLV